MQKLINILRRFKLSFAFRLIVFEGVRRICHRYCLNAYAKFGEDLIVCQILRYYSITQDFYVDVGSNHPIRNSNTFALYKQGFSGINIDANRNLIRLADRVRPNDTNIAAAISQEESDQTFTYFWDDNTISTLNKDHVAERWGPNKRIKHQETITTKPLQSIFREYKTPKEFAMLSVDVEGVDYEVLTSFDITEFRPLVIIIEIHEELSNLQESRIYQHLCQNNYRLVAYTGVNGIFVDKRLHSESPNKAN